jgi:hypothetical protein
MNNYIDLFNTKFREFVADLVKVFPEDSELKLLQKGISLILVVNERLVLNIYRDRVLIPFGDKLMERNEEFFLENNYQDIQKDVEDGARIIEKVKGFWKTLDPDNKEVVWKYLQVLLMLCKKVEENK